MVSNVGIYGAADYAALRWRSVQTGRTLGDMTPSDLPPMLNPRPPDFAAAGFGGNSVSVPGAAIRTIQRGVEGAREAVPTVEELRAELRARLAERDRQLRETEAERQRQADQTRQAQRAEQAPGQFKTATAAINLSFGGGDARGGPSVQINGQVTRYPVTNEQTAPQPAPALDLLA